MACVSVQGQEFSSCVRTYFHPGVRKSRTRLTMWPGFRLVLTGGFRAYVTSCSILYRPRCSANEPRESVCLLLLVFTGSDTP